METQCYALDMERLHPIQTLLKDTLGDYPKTPWVNEVST
jgi:hypothetical protein